MIESVDGSSSEFLEQIRIYTDDDVISDKYCAYRIEIETDERLIVLEGCHDMTPEVKEK